MWLTHNKPCHSIISLCWFTREWIDMKIQSQPDIIRLEAKNDTVLSQERKESYKKLQKDWITIKYILDENSDHDDISKQAIEKIIKLI